VAIQVGDIGSHKTMKDSATQKTGRDAKDAKDARGAKDRRVDGQLALLCLSGKRTGQEQVLPTDRPLILGRSRQADIRLDDDLTSRQHTKISFAGGKFLLEDLKSKNGTHLNGHKISAPTALKAGDYVRVGDCTFHVILPCVVESKAQAWWEKTQHTLATMKRQTERNAGAASVVSGSLAEVSLLDLLQLLANSVKTGLVTIRCQQDKGEVYLRQGQIYYATINNAPSARPDKVIYRILRWKDGTFTFIPSAETVVDTEILDPTSALLLEGVRLADELSAYDTVLPPLSAELRLASPLPEPLRNLSPEELDVVQLVLEQKILLKVLDAFPGTDLDASILLAGLFKRKVVEQVESPVKKTTSAK